MIRHRRVVQRRLAQREPRRVSPYEIPTVADYAHHNEDAALVWYAENRYDMEHPEAAREAWEEEMNDRDDRYDPDPIQTSFATQEEAQLFYANLESTPEFKPDEWKGVWYVEHYGCNERGGHCLRDMGHRGAHRWFEELPRD